MKWFVTILGTILATSLFGQSTADLDKKGGFRDYRIGTQFSVYNGSNLVLQEPVVGKTKTYRSMDKIDVTGLEGNLDLTFYNNQLIDISISFKNTSLFDFEDLLQSLFILYGHQVVESSNPSYLRHCEKVCVWKGSSIGLQLSYDADYRFSVMSFWGLEETRQLLKDEF